MVSKKQIRKEIRAIKKILAKPQNWTKRVEARDKDGFECEFDSKNAVCFCLSGALNRVDGSWETEKFLNRLIVKKTHRWKYLTQFNDAKRTDHKKVIGFLNEAIATV